MGISNPDCTTYEGTMEALQSMTEIPVPDAYDDVNPEEYNLPYEAFAS